MESETCVLRVYLRFLFLFSFLNMIKRHGWWRFEIEDDEDEAPKGVRVEERGCRRQKGLSRLLISAFVNVLYIEVRLLSLHGLGFVVGRRRGEVMVPHRLCVPLHGALWYPFALLRIFSNSVHLRP